MKAKILQVCLLSQDLILALILLVVNSDLAAGQFSGKYPHDVLLTGSFFAFVSFSAAVIINAPD